MRMDWVRGFTGLPMLTTMTNTFQADTTAEMATIRAKLNSAEGQLVEQREQLEQLAACRAELSELQKQSKSSADIASIAELDTKSTLNEAVAKGNRFQKEADALRAELTTTQGK